MMHALTLALETAGNSLGVALLSGQDVRVEKILDQRYGAAGMLMPMIKDILTEGQCDVSDLALIAVNIGPGSFTGLRTGIAAAQGLALGLSCPLVGISAFQALACPWQRQSRPFPLSLLLTSRRDDPFAAIVAEDLSFLSPPCFLPHSELTAWKAHQQHLLADSPDLADRWEPVRPSSIGWLAQDSRFHLPAEPAYLRPPEISKPKT